MTFRYRSAPYMWARSLVPAHQALALSAVASEMSVSFRQAGCPHGARPAGNFGEQKQGRKHQSEAVQGRYLIFCFLYILTAHRHAEWPLLGAEGFFFLADHSVSFSIIQLIIQYHSAAIAHQEIRWSQIRQAKRTTLLSTLCSILGRKYSRDSPRHSQLLIQDFIHRFQSPFAFSHFLKFTDLRNSSLLLNHKTFTHLPPALLSRRDSNVEAAIILKPLGGNPAINDSTAQVLCQ